ncbi:MAG: hypothetical protein CMJ18_28205, partial [Phycisphaeraceae bacterium]|nr:hypothetical protein [Phycisphaeraceae bacterium]
MTVLIRATSHRSHSFLDQRISRLSRRHRDTERVELKNHSRAPATVSRGHPRPAAGAVASVIAGGVAICLVLPAVCHGKVLLLAHYDGKADAEHARGDAKAKSVGARAVAGAAAPGRWGRALDLRTGPGGRCTYGAAGNFDPRRGTIDFWYVIDEDEPAPDNQGMYHPLIGWYDRPGGAFEIYARGDAIRLNVYRGDVHEGSWGPGDPATGNWHHLEVSWDCTGEDGRCAHQIFLDGRRIIRLTTDKVPPATAGAVHVGIWNYAFDIFLHGRVDELRITDQVEHLTDFSPPTRPYATPGTPAAVRAGVEQIQADLGKLAAALSDLTDAAALTGDEVAGPIGAAETAMTTAKVTLDSVTASLRASDRTDPSRLQRLVDESADALRTAHRRIAVATGRAYAGLPDLYNRTVVDVGYLKDEIEGLNRALHYADDIVDERPARDAVARGAKTVRHATDALVRSCEVFFDAFGDAKTRRADPAASTGDPAKRRVLAELTAQLTDVAGRVAGARGQVRAALRRLRDDPALRARFGRFREHVPAPLPPVDVAPDGTLKRLIFAGPTAGRTDVMLPLGFDVRHEDGPGMRWVEKNRFETHEDPKVLAQWREHGMPLSATVLNYAIGDSMANPPWFREHCGDNLDYFIHPSPNYIGTGGYEYRHPEVRDMIQSYLEEAARRCAAKPYTFIYKGPWEAHPYTGYGLSVPDQRVWAAQELGFSKFAVRAFRKYLAGKFESIDALNRAWRCAYDSFDAIEPPEAMIEAYFITKDERDQRVFSPFLPRQRVRPTPLTYEFERCRKDLYADYLADCRAAIRRGDPRHPLASSTSGGIMDEGLIRSIDDLQMAERGVDMWGKHPSGGYGWDDSPYMWGMNRYFGKTLVSLEYYGWAQEEFGDDFWPTFTIPEGTTAEDIYHAGRRDVWHELSWDRRMLIFYWTQKIVEIRGGVDMEHSPLIRPFINLVSVVKRRASRVNDVFMDVPIVRPRIGVLHPGVSIINAFPTNACRLVTRDVMHRLLAKQYHFGIVAEKFIVSGRDALDRYDVLILPYVQSFDDGFGEKLLAWVRGGGTLISAGPFGLVDKYGFDCDAGATAVFPELTFTYPPPGKYTLSWRWDAVRDGGATAATHLVRAFGRGTVLMTLDGRAFGQAGAATAQPHVGTEIGG